MVKCAWCGNIIDGTGIAGQGYKDDEGNLVCEYCYDEALMEARLEAKERKLDDKEIDEQDFIPNKDAHDLGRE
jgi:hypothetical protein